MSELPGRKLHQTTSTTTFGLTCPACRLPLKEVDQTARCTRCAHSYLRTDGIWRFVLPSRRSIHERFLCAYGKIRSAEGWGSTDPAYYQQLPLVTRHDPQKGIWRLRANTLDRVRRFLAGMGPLSIVDAGAGNCWLSNHLFRMGHAVACVDISDDARDGLGAGVHYGGGLDRYQAEFDFLPFQDGQFALVIFNGSLHYTQNVAATLCEARRVLTPGGRIMIMDSPFYPDAGGGKAMLRERAKKQGNGYPDCESRIGFLTESGIQNACSEVGLIMKVPHADAKWHQKLRRRWIKMRIGREPARFPIILLVPTTTLPVHENQGNPHPMTAKEFCDGH